MPCSGQLNGNQIVELMPCQPRAHGHVAAHNFSCHTFWPALFFSAPEMPFPLLLGEGKIERCRKVHSDEGRHSWLLWFVTESRKAAACLA